MLNVADRGAPWRSIHFVPANVPKYVAKSEGLEADAFQIDLEDSVPEREKGAARDALPAVIARLAATGADVLVRVNRPLGLAVRDIEAAVCEQVAAISLTKVDGPSHVRLMAELIEEMENKAGMTRGHTRLIVIIETAAAFAEMHAIARASPRVAAMMLGREDLAVDLGAVPLEEVLLGPKQQMIIAARAAGVTPLGYIGSIAGFRDEAAFRAMVRRSRQFGYAGGTSIHPSQIAALNIEYGLPEEEITAARRVVQAAEAAARDGRGSFELDGRMVDAPGLRKARSTLEVADRLAVRTHLRAERRRSAAQSS
jgi:citrate lyase subunit beta/citryl-CoA lyase